jgi:hypothetical protein
MKIDNRQQVLLLVAGIAIGLLVADSLILQPLTRSWKARAERIVELRKYIAQGQQVLERETITRSRWNHMRTNTLSANISLAEQQMLKAFDRWAQDSRITTTSIKPQWKRAQDDSMTLECRVDASGSLATISRFLYNLEKDPLAVRVEALELASRDDGGNQLTLGLQVSGLVLQPQRE